MGIIGDSMAVGTHSSDMCGKRDIIQCINDMLGLANREWSYVGGIKTWSIATLLGYTPDWIVDASANGAEWRNAFDQAQIIIKADLNVNTVFIGLGANDVCKSYGDNYTGDLQAISDYIDQTLRFLTDHLPAGSRIYWIGVPDIVTFRNIMVNRDHNYMFESCQATWDLDGTKVKDDAVKDACDTIFPYEWCKITDNSEEFKDDLMNLILQKWRDIEGVEEGPCGKILNSHSTDLDRQEARQFTIDLNQLMADKAQAFNGRNGIAVRYSNRVFDASSSIKPYHISRLDCYHPSRAGQMKLAYEIWKGFNPDHDVLMPIYFDEFESSDYCNQEFTSWDTCWTELGENDGPLAGDIKITNQELRVRNNNRGLWRGANLAGVEAAWLSFNWRREDLDNSSDYVSFDISPDGGLTWYSLDRFKGDGSDYGMHRGSYYDIAPYATANTRIRLLSSGSLGDDNKVYFDNVNIMAYRTIPAPLDFDGDGIVDDQDAFPNDPNEWEDTDSDGIGNNADLDDDNDGAPDGVDSRPTDSRYRGSEMGKQVSTHEWAEIVLPSLFDRPVTIMGPPTFRDSQPGVVRLQNVTTGSFTMRFQEWDYLDGIHTAEEIPHLVLEQGRRTMPDGSIWEVGTFDLGGTNQWQTQFFSQAFAGPPHLFLTVQTTNDVQAVTVRASDVTADHFKAALFEQEQFIDGHGMETVGYLAIYNPTGSGSVNLGGHEWPYLLQRQTLDERWTPVLSSSLKLEEEKSQDAERNHNDETVAVLALGPYLFAQDVSSQDTDTIALRRTALPSSPKLEWGTVSGVTDRWLTVPLTKTYKQPVMIAKLGQRSDPDLGVVRMRQVAPNSFQVRFQEWNYLDGSHPTAERIFYLVAEKGKFNLAGLLGQAGTVATDRLLGQGSRRVTLTQPFNTPPALFTSVMTAGDNDAVTTRVQNLTTTGFGLAMQEQESKADGHATETLGWIAIAKGLGTVGNRKIEITDVQATHLPAHKDFASSFNRRYPVVLCDLNSSNGWNTAVAALQNLTPSSVECYVQEEQSLDPEMNHVQEILSVFAAE